MRQQNRRLITYGKSSRSHLQTNANKNRPSTSVLDAANPEQQTQKRTPHSRCHTRSEDSPDIKGKDTSKVSASAVARDSSAEQYPADIEVYDVSFASQPTRRKRRKRDSDDTPFSPDGNTSYRPPSNDDNSPFPSNHDTSNKSRAPAASITPTRHTASPRKRLVDSLRTAEPSGEESASLNASNRESPAAPSRSSPIRRKDSNASLHETEVYNEGSQQSAAPNPAHSRTARITYARQRSFLNENAFSSGVGDQASAAPLSEASPLKQARSGLEAAPQSRSQADYEENGDGGSVRGLHELRQAGENARFRGTVDSIFEDIEDACNSQSSPCSGFAQLCAKLSDPRLARRFADCGFEKRFLQCLTADLDMLSAFFALSAYELIRASAPLSYTLLAPFLPTLLDLSSGLLGMDDDIVPLARKRRSSTVSRAAQSTASRLSAIIYGQQSGESISPRIVALRCIQSILSSCQEAGDNVEAIPSTFLDELASLLMRVVPSTKRFSASPEGFQVLISTLSTLEICSTLPGALGNKSRDACQSLSQLSNILEMKPGDDNDRYQQLLVLYIRVILNVTNSDPSFCDDFATPKVVEGLVGIIRTGFGEEGEGSQTEDNSLDAVILALGALTNLAEKCKSSRAVFLKSTIDSVTLLNLLLDLFSASVGSVREAHSLLEVHHNVAVGYLSILLVTLALHREARSVIRKSLDGKGLIVVLSTVKEFLQYHHKVEQDLSSEEKDSQTSGFTARLQSIMSEVEKC